MAWGRWGQTKSARVPGAGRMGTSSNLRYPYDRIMLQSPQFYYPMNDLLGSSVALNHGSATGSLVRNGGFEQSPSGANTFEHWNLAPGTGTITKTTTAGEFHSGAAAVKMTSIGANVAISQKHSVQPGSQWRLSFWTRGDGVNAGQYYVFKGDYSGTLIPITSTGISGIEYQQVTADFTVPAGVTTIEIDFKTAINGAAFYVDDVSLVCLTRPQSGADGRIINAVPQGDSFYFDGNGDCVNLANDSLATNFNGLTGSYVIYGKIPQAAYTDGVQRFLVKLKTSSTGANYVDCWKSSENNRLGFQYADDGTGDLTRTKDYSGLDLFSMGCTWGPENGVKFFHNQEKVATVAITGVWTKPFQTDHMAIGSDRSVGGWADWIGYLRDFAVWDRELSESEMAGVSQP
jgi:hypothetical protein